MREGVYISLIAAVSDNDVIGVDNGLPWHLPRDLKWFKETTRGHAVIMGRKTFDSLGGKALPDRVNVVLTRDEGYAAQGAVVAHSWARAVEHAVEAEKQAGGEQVFILGGEQVYRMALGQADRLYLTRVHGTFAGNAHFPAINWRDWRQTFSESHPADERHTYGLTFERYERVGA